MTKRWRKIEWRKVIWLNEAMREELAECAEYAPDGEPGDGLIHIDRLEVPVEGLKGRIERLSDGDG